MLSPIVICGGMFRSGSTWSFNVCRELLQLACRRSAQPLASVCFSPQETEYFLMSRSGPLPGPVVIKTHLLAEVTWQWIHAGRAKGVVTLRDPRDCVASDLKFMSMGFDKSMARIIESLKSLPPSLDSPHALFIAYEKMRADTAGMIGRIAAHLGIDLAPPEILQIDARTNMEASRKICQSLQKAPSAEIEPGSGHRIDAKTQLHANHIDSGKVGRWKQDLTAEQVAMLNRAFHKWMPILGYSS